MISCASVNEALLQVAGVADRCLYNASEPALQCISPQIRHSTPNRTGRRTQIRRDKFRCFLLKELDCFTRHFCRSYLKANKVSKSEATRKLNVRIIFESVLMLFIQNYQNQSMLVETTVCQIWLVLSASLYVSKRGAY